MRKWFCFLFVSGLLCTATASADVRLPKFMGDHMVLQRDMPIPLWGWAAPGEKVTATLGDDKAEATADDKGEWRLTLPARPAGDPLTLTVTGKNKLTLTDILMGEVWLCSGQSNMEWVVQSSTNAAQEIANANYPQIRQIKIPKVPSGTPQDDVAGTWAICSPQTAGGFTAAGYFMARKLNQELGVPIGLINSSWGGTAIEPWTPPEGFAGVPELKSLSDQVQQRSPGNPAYQKALNDHIAQTEAWLQKAKAATAAGNASPPSPAFPESLKAPATHSDATGLYNGMIHPFVGWPIRGAIWYQGETNSGDGMRYRAKMEALIEGWRKVWGIGDFPFYFVQIAPFQYGASAPSVLAEFWEAQAESAKIPNTGMVVTTDIATINDIHPPNKQDVGLRLALLALHRTYGKSDVVDSGPTFKSIEPKGNELVVTFENTAGGLKSRDGQALTWFEVIGPDSGWTKAEAKIDGDTVILSAPGVSSPAAMRFAWHKLAEPNLANGAGLPATAFRAGEVPRVDFLSQVDDAKAYRLMCDIDLQKLAKNVTYDVDNRSQMTTPFDRIGYLVELQSSGGAAQFVFVSMDAFTNDIKKIGIPDLSSGAVFQQQVKNLTVVSNAAGITSGANLDGGNIEFWPHNYGQQNTANVPGASNTTFDFGDFKSDPQDGYGSMQVHNFKAKQTLFSINHWANGSGADLGIGNSTGENSDWTFSGNAGNYTTKRLRVFVRPTRQ
ncbi:sialate O-acetylesterase [Planctomicrobium piriforme]|uniref:sialate O-acetylesterase n=1 Tax=Planctomicrobium piriforme TaxID=1576369 RepID=UPI001C3184DC|nr:sialate O-acetylesterase [Planctomicrobium piriforme]